jgi:C1A family cysteine protease
VNRGGGKKILCADNDSDANGTQLVAWDDNDRPACRWKFMEAGKAGILYGAGSSVVTRVEVAGGWDRYIYAWGEYDVPDTERWTAIRSTSRKDNNDMGNFWDISGDGELTRGAGKPLQLWEMACKFQKSPEIDRRYKFLPLWERTGRVEDMGYYIIHCNTGYYLHYRPAEVIKRKVMGREISSKSSAHVEVNISPDLNSDPAYHWKIDNTGKNRFTISTRADGSFITAAGKASDNGAPLVTSQTKTANSQWEFIIISKFDEKKSTEELAGRRAEEINKKLNDLSSEIRKKGYRFTVKATSVMNKTVREITGAFDVEPDPSTALYMKDDRAASSLPAAIRRSADMPAFNWRDMNMMTPVKNQMQCGSCWAFSGLAVCEGVYRIMYGKELDLSEQYAVDCLEGMTPAGKKADCGSCGGGNVPFLFRTMVTSGVTLESQVPYLGRNGTCVGKSPEASFRIRQYGDVSSGNPSVREINEALCKYGPVFSSLKVTRLFMAYGGGVYDEKVPVSGPRDTNHAIVIVGWDDGKKAWLVRNSWSEEWGEKGYVWVEYGCANIGNNVAWIRL